jgi:hypothetical protein
VTGGPLSLSDFLASRTNIQWNGTRAVLDARLASTSTATTPATTPVAQGKPVSEMSAAEKLGEAIRRSLPMLPDEVRDKVASLLSPESLATMGVITAAWAASHAFGVGEVADAVLLVVGAVTLGSEAFHVAGDLGSFVSGALGAQTEADLDNAAQHFARAISTVGVDTIAAILTHKAASSIKGNLPKPPAGEVEMVTPEGVRIRVPVEEAPPARPGNGDNRLLSQGTGTGGGSPKPITLQTLEHVFRGEVNPRGKAVGFHYEGAQMEAAYGTKVIESTRSAPDANGVYTARVEVRGVAKQARSSFFPRSWSRLDVVKAINEAYTSRAPVAGRPPNYFEGKSSGGVTVGMYVNPNGTIATAFPIYGR